MDHVRYLDPFERGRSRGEGCEAGHGPDPLLDHAMILLNHVVEIPDPHHLDRDEATEPFQHTVDLVDACRIGPASIDDDLPRQPVSLQRSVG